MKKSQSNEEVELKKEIDDYWKNVHEEIIKSLYWHNPKITKYVVRRFNNFIPDDYKK
jgi:hypothetical protein